MLAEWTVATLHVCKLILVLDEEATTVFTHCYRHVWHHVLEVSLGYIRAEVVHVLDKDLLKAHTSHDFLVDVHWLIVLWGGLVLRVLQETLSE